MRRRDACEGCVPTQEHGNDQQWIPRGAQRSRGMTKWEMSLRPDAPLPLRAVLLLCQQTAGRDQPVQFGPLPLGV